MDLTYLFVCNDDAGRANARLLLKHLPYSWQRRSECDFAMLSARFLRSAFGAGLTYSDTTAYSMLQLAQSLSPSHEYWALVVKLCSSLVIFKLEIGGRH